MRFSLCESEESYDYFSRKKYFFQHKRSFNFHFFLILVASFTATNKLWKRSVLQNTLKTNIDNIIERIISNVLLVSQRYLAQSKNQFHYTWNCKPVQNRVKLCCPVLTWSQNPIWKEIDRLNNNPIWFFEKRTVKTAIDFYSLYPFSVSWVVLNKYYIIELR